MNTIIIRSIMTIAVIFVLGLVSVATLYAATRTGDPVSGVCPIPHLSTQDACTITAPTGKTLTIEVNEGYDEGRLSRVLSGLTTTKTSGVISATGLSSLLISPTDGDADFYYYGVFGAAYENADRATKKRMKQAMLDGDCTNTGIFTTQVMVDECTNNKLTPGLIWQKEASTFVIKVVNGDNTIASTTTYYIHDNFSPFWATDQITVAFHRDEIVRDGDDTQPLTPSDASSASSCERDVSMFDDRYLCVRDMFVEKTPSSDSML
ncbi:MAG: hypothetical protein F4X82_02010 [Candidatus Spechtbacteria bacterium SB0662_bin_43]|uniref:Uncharacterized protein n=1 Tax=Candidatus Spechtbacteria bacterium SB0662_bin_43 TaxID=2604897 RepID=A0A845D9V5_9BACT|nr:hypothetical protein [Candidatus Spechtbacteria bacterium SB0662_bin_43]